jgi:hypothetical protein
MCWEDIKIGRSTSRAFQSTILNAATPTLFVPRNLKRIALIIGQSSSAGIVIAPKPTFGITEGLLIPVNSLPIYMSVDQFGAAVWDEWFAMAVSGAPFIAIVEIVLNTENPNELPKVM